jgi:hypothetical protein
MFYAGARVNFFVERFATEVGRHRGEEKAQMPHAKDAKSAKDRMNSG